jgi:hypothetical protein
MRFPVSSVCRTYFSGGTLSFTSLTSTCQACPGESEADAAQNSAAAAVPEAAGSSAATGLPVGLLQG